MLERVMGMEWIKCSDRMPEENKNVLIYTTDNCIYMAYLLRYNCPESDIFCLFASDEFEYLSKVTHWMPLPQPPEVE